MKSFSEKLFDFGSHGAYTCIHEYADLLKSEGGRSMTQVIYDLIKDNQCPYVFILQDGH